MKTRALRCDACLEDFDATALGPGAGRFRRALHRTSPTAKPTTVGAAVLRHEPVNGLTPDSIHTLEITSALCAACAVAQTIRDAADGRGATERWTVEASQASRAAGWR